MTENQIYLADCFELMPQLQAESADLIFTDPPYQTALADLYDWRIDWVKLADQFDRILKPSGQIAVFSDWPTAITISAAFGQKFRFRFYWIWQKLTGQPVNFKKGPIRETEFILVFSKRDSRLKDLTFNYQEIATLGEPYQRKYDRQNLTRKKLKSFITVNEGWRYPREVLTFPTKCNFPEAERTAHPTQKPLGLCEYVIKALTNPGDLVLDPFAGSGTIPIAAYRLGRRFIGVERDPEYFKIAKRRLSVEMAQQKIFEVS